MQLQLINTYFQNVLCTLSFQIAENEKLGRYLIATRSIKENEVILREPPLIWGPAQMTVPVCLGCGIKLNNKNCKPCSRCGWPVCSETCENSMTHVPECWFTVNRGDKVG